MYSEAFPSSKMGKNNWFKREFQISNFKFDHDTPEDFVISQWQDESINWVHVVYRWALCLFFFCLVVASWVAQKEAPELWLIYLTHWGIMFCCLQALIGASLVTARLIKMKKIGSVPYYEQMPKHFMFYWAFHNGTVTVAFGISIIYWTLLHSAEFNNVMNFMTHGMNSLLMFIDLFVIAHPIRLLHVYIPVCVAVVYCLFSLIYFWAGGLDPHGNHFIYNILDWNNPGPSLIVVFGGLFLIFLLQILVFLLYRLRVLIYKRINKRTMLVLPISTISGRTNMGFNNDTEKS